MNGPNFFLVGAAKSGTTTLYRALQAHDDVYLPDLKEPHVYAHLADPSTAPHLYADEGAARARYGLLYGDVAGHRAVGDGSTTSLVVPGAAALIAQDVPAARIVAILRHPVDRAFSHFCHFVTAGGEELHDFAEAVREEPRRRAEGWPFTYQYLGWGRYGDQLRPFFEHFDPDRVLVHLYDDLCCDGEGVVRSTLRFLGVDETAPIPPIGRHNVVRPAVATARGRLGRLPRRVTGRPSAVPTPRPTLDPSLRAELTASFGDQIDELESLLGRDLSAWRA